MPMSVRKDSYSAPARSQVRVLVAPDYKEPLALKKFVTDRGKLIPAKRTGVTAKIQREIATQVKRARFMALLPYTDRHAL